MRECFVRRSANAVGPSKAASKMPRIGETLLFRFNFFCDLSTESLPKLPFNFFLSLSSPIHGVMLPASLSLSHALHTSLFFPLCLSLSSLSLSLSLFLSLSMQPIITIQAPCSIAFCAHQPLTACAKTSLKKETSQPVDLIRPPTNVQ